MPCEIVQSLLCLTKNGFLSLHHACSSLDVCPQSFDLVLRAVALSNGFLSPSIWPATSASSHVLGFHKRVHIGIIDAVEFFDKPLEFSRSLP